MHKLALQFIRYYKMQSLAISAGMALSIALLTGISSLIYSGQRSDLMNARMIHGDWNYWIPEDTDTVELVTWDQTPGYEVEKYGILKIVKDPDQGAAGTQEEDGICMQYADEAYLDMMGQPVIEGHYPQSEDEIAMSPLSMKHLGIAAQIGGQAEVSGREYTLSGILKDPWSLERDRVDVFISQNAAGADAQSCIYLKLDESVRMHQQRDALMKDLGIGSSEITGNRDVNAYLGEEDPFDMIMQTVHLIRRGKFRFSYIARVLSESYGFMAGVIIIGLRLFAVFVTYSIFQINLAKRISEHGILQALGIGRMKQYLLVLDELLMLLFLSFPAGAFLGTMSAEVLYQRFQMVFLDQGVVQARAFHSQSMTGHFMDVTKLSAQAFEVGVSALIFDFLFLAAAMALAAYCLVIKTESMTAVQMMKQTAGQSQKAAGRIYSRKSCYMPGVVNGRLMYADKGSFVCILVSLSLGGVFFLCTNYVMVNTKAHNQMQLASDDGLGSDFKIYKDNVDFGDVLDKDLAERIQKVKGVRQVYGAQSYPGELLFDPGEFLWTSFFESSNKEYASVWNGLSQKREDGGCDVKCNVLGYDDRLIGMLEPYMLEGSCNAGRLRKNNEIILVTLRDGQGNYDGITKHAGDKIALKVPKELSGNAGDLKLAGSAEKVKTAGKAEEAGPAGKTEDTKPAESVDDCKPRGEDSRFEIMEFTIGAIVKRSLLKDSRLYTDEAVPDLTFSIIMTHEQMRDHFGIGGCRVLGIETDENADTMQAAEEVSRIVSGKGDVVFQDYTDAIKKQNEYIGQKTYFLRGIAGMFFVISLFHIINAMSHVILSNKQAYGVMRAMGITDQNFLRMMAAQGFLYGSCASLVMIVLYAAAVKIAEYFMVHIYNYLVTSIQVSPAVFLAMTAINIIVAIAAVMVPACAILKEDMIDQMNMQR